MAKRISLEDLIIYEDDDYIVINKPPYIASLDERTEDRTQSILSMARKYHPDIQLGHRLDKETSGCLAIAKHPEAYRHLAMQFEHRQVKKLYHAVISDIRDFEGVEIDLPILKLTKKGMVAIDMQEGKKSQTIFNTIEIFKYHTLVECQPVTGRMHQIRIHLACMDAPIVGDKMYGGRHFYLSTLKKRFKLKTGTDEQPLIKRFALHAYNLSFEGISTKEINAIAPYPKDFRVLVSNLKKYTTLS